jgi:hypothetical protein
MVDLSKRPNGVSDRVQVGIGAVVARMANDMRRQTISMRALLLVLLAGCATTRVTKESPPSQGTSPEQAQLLTTLFTEAANADSPRLESLVDWARFRRVQTWDMVRMEPALCFILVPQLLEDIKSGPRAGWREMSIADVRRRLGFVAPGGVPPTAEPSHILDELHQDRSEQTCPTATDSAAEVLQGAHEVTYRGQDGSTLTMLLVGNRLAGLIGTPGKR